MSVALTIRDQIRITDRMAFGAWGAKDFVDMGNGLKFKTSGMTPWKGYVHIVYDEGLDLYRVDFFRIRNLKPVYDKRLEGVYCDQLVSVIDNFVG